MKEFWDEFKNMYYKFIVAMVMLAGVFGLAEGVRRAVYKHSESGNLALLIYLATMIYLFRITAYGTKITVDKK